MKDQVNTMGTQANPHDMPAEIDFSDGTRGKFFKPGAAIDLPVYLEAEVQAYLAARAKAKGIESETLRRSGPTAATNGAPNRRATTPMP
jgi:hypothetical protein